MNEIEVQLITEKSLNALATIFSQRIKSPATGPKIVIFLGAGASQSSGVPTSKQLIKELKGQYPHLFIQTLEKELEREFKVNFESPELTLEMVCSVIASLKGADEINSFISEKFPQDFSRRPLSHTYEILAHLINHKFIDHVISTNYDELLEWALDDEIGKDRYFRAVSWEDFAWIERQDIAKNRPIIFKPYGTVSIWNSMKWHVEGIKDLHPTIFNCLYNLLKDAFIVFIGYACKDPAIKKLLQQVSQAYGKRIFIVNSSFPDIQSGFLDIFSSQKNQIILKSDKFFESLLEKVNECIEDEIKVKNICEISRHLLRKEFLDNQLMENSIANQFMLEVIIYAVKARGEFTSKGLGKCLHIANQINLLQAEGISPKELIGRLENRILNCLVRSDLGIEVYEIKSFNDLIEGLWELFGKRPKNEVIERIKDIFKQLMETFDIDIYIDPEITLEFYAPRFIINHFNFINLTKDLISKAERGICVVSETAEWLLRTEYEDVLSRKNGDFKIFLITADWSDLEKIRGNIPSWHLERMEEVSKKLKERFEFGGIVSIPWYKHNEHFTFNDKGIGIYFSRDAKCPVIISPIWIDDEKDYQWLLEKFKAIWEQNIDDNLPDWVKPNQPISPIEERELNFKKEREAFMRLSDDVKRQYANKFVAIYKGKIVDSDDEESKLLERFYGKFGEVTVYIDKIEETRPIIYVPTPLKIL